MDNFEKELLAKATEMFTKYGLRPITMDDIAAELGVSKKTLYKYVSNKNELVQQTVQHVFEKTSTLLNSASDQSKNAIDELFIMDEQVCETIENYNHSLQFQLKKYHPEVYSWLEEHRQQVVLSNTRANITRGQREGLYRKDLNMEIITLLYYSRTLVLTGHELDPFKDFDIRKVMREILIYHVRGLATEKGVQYLQEKLNANN